MDQGTTPTAVRQRLFVVSYCSVPALKLKPSADQVMLSVVPAGVASGRAGQAPVHLGKADNRLPDLLHAAAGVGNVAHLELGGERHEGAGEQKADDEKGDGKFSQGEACFTAPKAIKAQGPPPGRWKRW